MRQPTIRHLLRVGVLAGVTLGGCAPQAIGEIPRLLVSPVSTATTLTVVPLATALTLPTSIPTPTALPTTAPTSTPEPPTDTLVPALPTTEPTIDSGKLAIPSAFPEATETTRQQVFDEVWNLVDQKYLYRDFNGIDWKAIYQEYLPRVEVASSDDEFYADISEMIALLNDHHSRFLPPAAAAQEDNVNSGEDTAVGIGVLTTFERDSAFIRTVFPDSPAARAGIKPRDRILAVDGHTYTEEDGDIQGPTGSYVRLSILRPGEKPRDVVLERQEVQSRITPLYRRFPGDIGYVAIPTLWANDMDAQVSGAITELVAGGTLRGVIVDLRGNSGGWGHVLSGILGHFVRGPVGTFFDQRSSRVLNVTTPAGPDLRGVPLTVLIDGDTQSYAEVLAAVLQENGATVIGTPSAGNTETIYVYTLRDQSRLWLAQENFKLRSGTNLEGHGVQPNELLDVEWKRYSEDDDPQILEALRILGAGPK